MRKTILLLMLFLLQTGWSQRKQVYDFNLVKSGVMILCKQFYADDKIHKAKILARFLNDYDGKNQDVRNLIESIKDEDPVRIYTEIADDGQEFYKYLEGYTRTLDRKDYIVVMSIIATTVNGNSPLQANITDKELIFSHKYYIELFPESDKADIPAATLSASEAAKKIIIPRLNYNPVNFIEAINRVNYLIKGSGVQIEFDEDNMEGIKDLIKSRDDSKGFTKFEAIPDPEAINQNIPISNISVYDFLRYLEFTTRLTFNMNDTDNIIYLSEAIGEKKDIPHDFMRSAKTLSDEIRRNPTAVNQKYGDKEMLILGVVTRFKDEGDFFLIELNGFFVVKVSKNRLKKDSQKNIEKYSLEFNKTKNQFLLKHLIVTVRGVLKVTTSRQRAIIDECTVILSRGTAHFYTK